MTEYSHDLMLLLHSYYFGGTLVGASGDAFRISAARWSPLGDSIMIMSPRSMCVCFMENSGGSPGKARSRAPPTAAASAENLQRQIQ